MSFSLLPLENLSIERLYITVPGQDAAAEKFGETADLQALKAAAEHVMASRALCVFLAEKKRAPFSEADTPYPRVGFHWPRDEQ